MEAPFAELGGGIRVGRIIGNDLVLFGVPEWYWVDICSSSTDFYQKSDFALREKA